jgi:hypothetical protein
MRFLSIALASLLATSAYADGLSGSAPANATNAVLGIMRGDGAGLSCTSGVCSVTGALGALAIPLCASFPTAINGGVGSPVPSCTDTAGFGMTFNAGGLAASNQIRAFCQNIPGAAPWTVTVGTKMNIGYYPGTSGYLLLTDGTKYLGFGYRAAGAGVNSGQQLTIDYYTSSTAYSSSDIAATQNPGRSPYLRIHSDGTNWTFSESQDGVNFGLDLTEAISTHAITATQFCVGASAFSATTSGNSSTQTVFYWNAINS